MRELFVKAVRSVIGRPYIWGGQSSGKGFDCSGLVIWALNEAGIKVTDMTALNLYRHFEEKEIRISTCLPGSLFFYGQTHISINHVN